MRFLFCTASVREAAGFCELGVEVRVGWLSALQGDLCPGLGRFRLLGNARLRRLGVAARSSPQGSQTRRERTRGLDARTQESGRRRSEVAVTVDRLP